MFNSEPTREVINMIPDIVDTIDSASKSATLWSKVKAGAVVVFLVGGIYVTLQSLWLRFKGIDEYQHHKSITKTSSTQTTRVGDESGTNKRRVKEKFDGQSSAKDKKGRDINKEEKDEVNSNESRNKSNDTKKTRGRRGRT